MSDPLPPGRELDRRVALDVLGWSGLGISGTCMASVPPGGDRLAEVPRYSTDATANTEVLKWMKSRHRSSLPGCETFEHAICLAALQVAEEERAAKAEAERLTAAGFRHGTPADFMATGESVVAQLNRLTDERDEARKLADRLQAELKRVQAERDDYAERIERVAEAIAGE